MGKDFEINNDVNSDIASDVNSDTRSDLGRDIANNDGMDLNKSGYGYGYGYGYDADPTEGTVSNNQSESEYDPDAYESSKGFLNEQHDLGNQLENPDTDFEKRGFSKAIDYTPPPIDIPQESAIYCDAPANVGMGTDGIDLNDFRNREIEEGMGPGPENDVEQPQEPEYADVAPDPPIDTDISE